MHKVSNIAIIEEMRPDCKRETATSPKNAKAAEKIRRLLSVFTDFPPK